jgi:hypothetical protein
MIFLSLNQNQVKILLFKKTVFSHYEVDFFEKNHQTLLLNNNEVAIDLVASAIKEGLDSIKKSQGDKEVYLILPQNFFIFLRTEVPSDIAPSALYSFVWEKVNNQYHLEPNQIISELFITQNQQKKIVNFFAINLKNLETFQKIFNLLNLKLTNIVPETLTYFKLFEKTLRLEKKENIFFVHYQKETAFGYLFDNFGLLDGQKWFSQINDKDSIEKLIKEKKELLEKDQVKINRLILSGPASENIRQDTFTKNVGIWTNPLKKIITNFYQDYLKLLMVENKEVLPILNLDVCFGAFVFFKENSNFSFLKRKNFYEIKQPELKKSLTIKKEWLIFFLSFLLSLLFFIFLSNIKTKISLPSLMIKPTIASPTPTPLPSPTPTPTIAINKETIRIKVLNGSGTPGKASAVKDILKEKGYQEILTGNADNFDYAQTEISVKKEKNNLVPMIKEDLKKYTSSFKITPLSEKEVSDVIIIIGKDFK